MHRFFISSESISGDTVRLSREESVHAARVLRLKAGAEVTLLNGQGQIWGGYLTDVEGERVTARLVSALPANEMPVAVTLYQGLPKFEKLDFIVQKATELGAARVVPVEMARSVARVDKKDASKKRERLEKIAREAAKQSGRAVVPAIAAPMGFEEALQDMRAREVLIVPWEDARGARVKDIFDLCPGARDIGVVVGPEGGMEKGEVDAIGGRLVTLGPRILRAETAAVVSVALIGQLWGDL